VQFSLFSKVFNRSSQTRATNSSAAAVYDYKVDLVNRRKELERLLKEDGRNDWRVHSVVAMGAYHDELAVILEKPGNISSPF